MEEQQPGLEQPQLRWDPAPARGPHATPSRHPPAARPGGRPPRPADGEHDDGHAAACGQRQRRPRARHRSAGAPRAGRDHTDGTRASHEPYKPSARPRSGHGANERRRAGGERARPGAPTARGHGEHSRRGARGTDERVGARGTAHHHAAAGGNDRGDHGRDERGSGGRERARTAETDQGHETTPSEDLPEPDGRNRHNGSDRAPQGAERWSGLTGAKRSVLSGRRENTLERVRSAVHWNGAGERLTRGCQGAVDRRLAT